MQTPQPRKNGSPCVFVDIYRVSPARLLDCICLRAALLVHTSHPLESSFLCEILVPLRSAAACMYVCELYGAAAAAENASREVFGIWALMSDVFLLDLKHIYGAVRAEIAHIDNH